MEDQMMSLYDYLGYAAGGQLGKEVANAAVKAKVQIDKRYVSNKAYSGLVMLYPKSFLKEYFENKQR